MNELLFFTHIAVALICILIALRLGKEALIALIVLQGVLANIFVVKEMHCFGLDITCADVYTIGSIFSINLLQNYFGKIWAERALKILFFLLLFVIAMSQIHLRYIPAFFDQTDSAFRTILGSAPRIMIISYIVAFIAQKVDIHLFAHLQKKISAAPLFIPFAIASLITQFFDTIAFSYGALYGIVHNIKQVIFMSYLIKVLIIISLAPFTLLLNKVMRRAPL